MVWDESKGEYTPSFGYKNQGKKDKDLSDWIQELKPDQGTLTTPPQLTTDPSTDLIATKRAEKASRIAKNTMQQRRNTEETTAKSLGIRHQSRSEIRHKLVQAKTANASNGVFDTLADAVKLKSGKRQFEDVTKSADVERAEGLAILEKMERGKGRVGVSKRGVHLMTRNSKKADNQSQKGGKKMAPKSGKKKRKM